MVTVEEIVRAQQTIAGRVHRTPLVRSEALGARIGVPLYLKLESWQKTGSFKPRGALNKIAALSKDERERGLVTASAGNHAQALAWAASAEGIACTVVMPATAPASKIAATQGYGASVVLEPDVTGVFVRARALVDEHGYTFIPPFDDPAIIAGQGTVGLEIAEDLPEVSTVVVPVGGGGLISGITIAVKSRNPDARIIGVEPEGSAAMWRSREAGDPVRLDKVTTIADGLSAPFAGELTFEVVQKYVEDLVLVTDEQIRSAMALILERCKVLAEPAGAAAVAALISGVISTAPVGPVVAVVSGGNVDVSRLATLLGASTRRNGASTRNL